jgi:hypothetical protein
MKESLRILHFIYLERHVGEGGCKSGLPDGIFSNQKSKFG